MAKQPPEPTYRSAELTADQIKRAIPKLEKRIVDRKNLDFSQMQERGGPQIQGIRVAIEQTLEGIFGAYSTEFRRYSSAAVLSGGPVSLSRGYHDFRFRDHYEKSRQASISTLEQAIQGLVERQADLESTTDTGAMLPAHEEEQQFSHRIFVVHGREGEHREAVARFLQQLGLEAIILHEQPNKGRALITKFHEVASDIGFAVVLMTPDDVGGLRDDGRQQQSRARQNVIFELGFFIGALGPDRVAALISNEVERPSDFDGVVYIPIESDWRLPLCRELRAAGYDIDLNKAL
jgi:predicted nucleotide-binding protein